ncbi:hypothetical protein [Nonomuraea guangzhouensis]|uniref:Phosphodiester glycosidase domain-containing protein n=1 Tax=Nonomuraea guangzhouensis TaxID=1291555 RepID=A0ABW4G0P0_9ACTN|nr:hypothetical protein [Nonomuraea guangzhouensis]
MVDQFDVIEAGQRGRRRWIGIGVVLALLAICVVSLLASRDPEPGQVPLPSAVPVPGPIRSLTRIEGAPNVVRAPAKVKGGDEVIPVVFPDGRHADVRYPAVLRLNELGARPFVGAWVAGHYRGLYAPYGGEMEISRGGLPIRNLTPNVTLWPRLPGGGPNGQVLMFAFGKWRLAMNDLPEGLTFEERLAAAKSLRGKVGKDGYLVLSGSGDAIRLAEPGETARGDPVGPQLWFGGGVGDMVALIPTPDCQKAARTPSAVDGRGRPAQVVCRGDVQIAASGSRYFIEHAIAGIRITLK